MLQRIIAFIIKEKALIIEEHKGKKKKYFRILLKRRYSQLYSFDPT